jgi:hypothetical protein
VLCIFAALGLVDKFDISTGSYTSESRDIKCKGQKATSVGNRAVFVGGIHYRTSGWYYCKLSLKIVGAFRMFLFEFIERCCIVHNVFSY